MTTSRIPVKPLLYVAAAAALLLAVALPAHAAGSNMPWEAPLQSVLESVQGPVAMMTITAMMRATGPWTDSSTDCSGASQGMFEPAACAGNATASISAAAAAT